MDEQKTEPWKTHPDIWKNSTAFFTYLRGCLRKAWNNNPIKISVLNKNRKQIPNPNPKGKKPMVWGADCALCKEVFPMKDIQVDHVHPAGSLTKQEDIEQFVVGLLFVSEEDLRLVCKKCHEAVTFAERMGISFEEALAEKQAIALMKQGTEAQKKWLEDRYIPPASNATERRKQIKRSILNENKV